MIAIVADQDFLCNDLGLPHYSKKKLCWYCPCDHDAAPWNDFTEDALFKSMCFSTRQALANPLTDCALFKAPGCHALAVLIDVMHASDQNGLLAHIAGNTLFGIVFDQIGGNPVTATDRLFQRCKIFTQSWGSTLIAHAISEFPCFAINPHLERAIHA